STPRAGSAGPAPPSPRRRPCPRPCGASSPAGTRRPSPSRSPRASGTRAAVPRRVPAPAWRSRCRATSPLASSCARSRAISPLAASPDAPRLALPATPPPVVDEVVHDLAELRDRPALAHEVARGRVEGHHAVADAPAPLPFGVEPDDALHALADEPERPRLRVVVVVARVAQDQDGRLPVERVELRLREPAERVAEVRPAVVVDRRALQRPLDRALDRIGAERLRHLRD